MAGTPTPQGKSWHSSARALVGAQTSGSYLLASLFQHVGAVCAAASVWPRLVLPGMERGKGRLGGRPGDSKVSTFVIKGDIWGLEDKNQRSEVRGRKWRKRRGQRSGSVVWNWNLFISASWGCSSSLTLDPGWEAGGEGHDDSGLRPPWRWYSGLVLP